jgi:SRSO17 transposase
MEWTREQYRAAIGDLAQFMSSLTMTIGRSERRLAAMQYVGGLLLPGRRKRIRPLAEWLGIDHQCIQQFLTDSPWNDETVWSAIRRRLVAQLDCIDLWLVDLRAWYKQGKHSVGVSYQSTGLRNKKSNCQISAGILLGCKSLGVPIAGRLYLPEAWAGNADLRRRAGVPGDIPNETSAELAIRLIRNALDDGVRKAPVVADSTFGGNSNFRRSLRELGFEYFLEIDAKEHRGCLVGDSSEEIGSSCPLDRLINGSRAEDWEHSFSPNGEMRTARVLWRRIQLRAERDAPEPCWLAVEWPRGAQSYYRAHVAHLDRPPGEDLASLLAASPACLRSHNQCFENILDLNSFQGRNWSGFHHHLVLAEAACAFVFLQALDQRAERVAESTAVDPVIHSEALRMATLI